MSDLISREAMLEELLSHFGVDLAYFGRDLQFVQELIEQIPPAIDTETLRDFIEGKWVESEKIQKALDMSFNECFSKFDFSRVSEWWSIVGRTEEEKQRNGQKITTYFKLKERCSESGSE